MFSAVANVSAGTLWGLVAMAGVAVGVLGFVTHLVLRERGFGLIPNGVLMLLGVVAGAWARYTIFGSL